MEGFILHSLFVRCTTKSTLSCLTQTNAVQIDYSQDLAKGNKNKVVIILGSEVFLSHMPCTWGCTSANQKPSWRRLFSYICAHLPSISRASADLLGNHLLHYRQLSTCRSTFTSSSSMRFTWLTNRQPFADCSYSWKWPPSHIVILDPLWNGKWLGYFFHPKVTLTRNLASHRKTGRIQRVSGLLACSVNLGLHHYKGEITLDLL